MGIQPTNAGIDFQQRISAFMMIAMEFDIDISAILNLNLKDKIEKLHFESSDKIDDLVLTTKTHKKIYMQIKRNITLSDDINSEFYSVCAQFVAQYLENNLDDFAYVLITRSQSSTKITLKLKKILDALRLNDDINIKDNLTQDETIVFEKVVKNIECEYKKISGNQISESILKNIFCRMYIEIFDIENGESFEKNIKLILHSKLNVEVELFWKMLISMSIQYAANRNCIDKIALHNRINEYINLQVENKSSLEIVWQDDDSEIQVQKDYVVALGNDEFDKLIEIDNNQENRLYIIELYRFEENEKKHTLNYIEPNIMVLSNGMRLEILFRCSSQVRLERFINENIERTANVIYIPTNVDVAEGDGEIVYRNLLVNNIEKQKESKCINCGKAICQDEIYLIELDNIECTGKAGNIHKECLRPIDRVLGVAKIPNIREYDYVKNFDINLWISLISKSKSVWENVNNLQQPISPFVINTDNIFVSGKYCVKTLLKNGDYRYVTYRNSIHCLDKTSAENYAKQLTVQYNKSRQANNPICYSSETYACSSYEDLLRNMGGKEEFLECISAEVAIYNDMIGKMYSDGETYYAPLIYLSIEGQPVILDGIFPLITNPLELKIYLSNWEEAGFVLENFEVNIIGEDNDFLLKILNLISEGIRPIVNMIVGKNKQLIKGCILKTMKEIKYMYDNKQQ